MELKNVMGGRLDGNYDGNLSWMCVCVGGEGIDRRDVIYYYLVVCSVINICSEYIVWRGEDMPVISSPSSSCLLHIEKYKIRIDCIYRLRGLHIHSISLLLIYLPLCHLLYMKIAVELYSYNFRSYRFLSQYNLRSIHLFADSLLLYLPSHYRRRKRRSRRQSNYP